MVKLALQLAGEFRTFEENYPYMKKHIIDLHEVDLYFYGYCNSKGIENNIEVLKQLDIKTIYKFVDYNDNLKQELLNLVQGYNFESRKRRETNVSNVISSFYNKFKVNELRKSTGFKYDFVLTTRTDLYVKRSIPEEIFKQLNKTNIAIPEGMDYSFINSAAVSDNFALGIPSVLDKYSNMFFHLSQIFNSKEAPTFHPETMCGLNLAKIYDIKRLPCGKFNPHRNKIYAAIWE